jgi:uncharacterized protein (DUF433 family)
MASHELSTGSWVQENPDFYGGAPRIRNPRHSVSGLVQWRNLGLSDARILEHHPHLTADDLEAAWDYYSRHRPEIDRAIRADEDA